MTHHLWNFPERAICHWEIKTASLKSLCFDSLNLPFQSVPLLLLSQLLNFHLLSVKTKETHEENGKMGSEGMDTAEATWVIGEGRTGPRSPTDTKEDPNSVGEGARVFPPRGPLKSGGHFA